MLSGFKSRPVSGAPRPIPYGGLGGCVEVKTESLKMAQDLQYEAGRTKIRKKPVPIQTQVPIYVPHVPSGALTCPVTSLASAPPQPPSQPQPPSAAVPQPDDNTDQVPTPKASEDQLNGLSPYLLWDRCKDNPWLTTVPRREPFSILPIRRQQTMPAELPGSLLLPSQGFAQSNPPATPPRQKKHSRADSGPAFHSPVPSLSYSCQSTPRSKTDPKSTYSSPLEKSLPKLPSVVTESFGSVSKPFALMNVEQLLDVLPGLEPDDVIDRWIKMMEKELAKLRVYVYGIDPRALAHLEAVRPFCEEIQSNLVKAKVVCESHTEAFRRAQESTDPNRDSDLAKVSRISNRLRDITPSLPVQEWHKKTHFQEFENLRTVLVDCIQILSGFIRNQITFQLHNQCRGLSDRTVRIIRDFDRGAAKHQDQVAPANVGEAKEVRPRNPNPKVDYLQPHMRESLVTIVSDEVLDTQSLHADQMELTKAKPEVQTLKSNNLNPQDIIQSYFDVQSSYSESLYDRDSVTQASTAGETIDVGVEYQDLISELDRESKHIHESFAPLKLSDNFRHGSISPSLPSPPSPLRSFAPLCPQSPVSPPQSPYLPFYPSRTYGGPLTSHPSVTSFSSPRSRNQHYHSQSVQSVPETIVETFLQVPVRRQSAPPSPILYQPQPIAANLTLRLPLLRSEPPSPLMPLFSEAGPQAESKQSSSPSSSTNTTKTVTPSNPPTTSSTTVRDIQVQSLRLKVQNLEVQNNLLRDHLETLTLRLEGFDEETLKLPFIANAGGLKDSRLGGLGVEIRKKVA